MDFKKQTETDLLRLEKRLKRKYSATWKEIRKPIERYLASFAERDAKMQADLKAGKIKLSKGQTAEDYYKIWRLKEMTTTEEWASICIDVAQKLTETDAECRSMIREEQPKIYEQNYNGTAFSLAVGAGIIYGGYVWLERRNVKKAAKVYALKVKPYPVSPAKKVKVTVPQNNVAFKILGTTGVPHYFTPGVDVPRDYRWNQQRMQQTLQSGILQGKATPKIAKDFLTVMGQNQGAATRIARTGVTSAQSCAALDAMYHAREMGLDVKKKWLATLDKRTRISHGHLDNEVRELEEPFSNGLQYPGDSAGAPGEVYNCRCTMETVYPGMDSPRERKAEDGRFTGTYDEWIKANQVSPGLKYGRRGNKVDTTLPDDIRRTLKSINPSFKNGGEHTKNCQRCVQAYEMSRRTGKIYTAKPNTGDRLINWGTEIFSASTERPKDLYVFEQSASKVKTAVKEAPEGARFVIYNRWKGSNEAHVFVAEKIDGKVRYLDPQSGEEDVSYYFKLGERGKFGYYRVDDKPTMANDLLLRRIMEEEE